VLDIERNRGRGAGLYCDRVRIDVRRGDATGEQDDRRGRRGSDKGVLEEGVFIVVVVAR
jgi:hypothetical protein